ncbi:DNA-binding helix-turn-helix protein [Bacteriovorax sp. BAL6_X]|uniref:helix-turn-helix domain-containing protein n=1 Tax=Bacteriovorax sp. BAL6_X TaxID=1201290 RepID=UPI000385EFD6|nr:helix-turn-helix domain-containing protein [Bacteriovorax sp. BAL6_X]EPZ52098.1 DNA-binding helix-turn-helix protein [Bacteriovorax sp. BAL6_X]
MEQEVAKEAPNLSLGQYLQKARDKKDLSIEAVSRHTRINLTNLSALEADDIERLPNIAYVRGFVKTLAKTYDIDAEEATKKLEELYGEIASEKSQPLEADDFPQANVEKKQDLVKKEVQISDSLKYKLLGVVAAFSIGIFVYINLDKSKEVDTGEDTKEVVLEAQVLDENTPMQDSAVDETTNDLVDEETPSQEIEEKKPEVVETKVEEKPAEEKPVEKKEEKEKELSFYNLPSPLFAFKDISEEEKNEIIPANIRAAFEEDKQNIFLKAMTGDSWIVYKSDNDPIKKFTLKEGRYLLIKGDQVLLRLGNIDALNVFYNGELLGMSSRSGVKSLVFPVEIAKDHKLPLFIFDKNGGVKTSKQYLEEKANSQN